MNASLRQALRNPWLQASAIALLALAVYVRTLAPTVMWYDMGEFQTAAYVLGIAHNTGYPLLLLLGKLFTFLPFGDVAYRVNLMSATFGALTVLLLYVIVFELATSGSPGTRQGDGRTAGAGSAGTGGNRPRPAGPERSRRIPAAIAALTLAFSSTLWSNATWATSYNLNAFLTLLILWLMLRWRATSNDRPLQLAALAVGLGLGNHRLILAAGAAAAYLAWRGGYPLARAWKPAAFFLLGFAVNLYLPLRAAQDPPVNWGDPSQIDVFLRMISTGYVRAFVNPFESLANLRSALTVLRLFPAYEITVVGLLLAAWGAWRLWGRDPQVLVATGIVVLLAGAMISVYGIHNIFNYFQPIYLMLGIWLGLGAGAAVGFAVRLGRQRQLGLLTADRRSALATALLLGLPLVLATRNFPILDRSSHFDARDYARYLLNRVEPGAVILADFWSWAPLLYAQVVDGVRTDVYVTNLLSRPDLDQSALTAGLAADGVPTYIALGIDDSPRLQLNKAELELIAPYAIHYYPTSALPLPQYKDLLVPKGAVYRVPQAPLDLTAAEVPPGARVEAQFADRLRLHGFEIRPQHLSPGDSFTAQYYWSVPSAGAADYWVEVQFTDAEQAVPTRLGIPIWLHSHWIGSEAQPTSAWEPGRLMRESYDGLVPRSVPPGRYFIWATVYQASGAQRPAGEPPSGSRPAQPLGDPQGAVLGTIEVTAP